MADATDTLTQTQTGAPAPQVQEAAVSPQEEPAAVDATEAAVAPEASDTPEAPEAAADDAVDVAASGSEDKAAKPVAEAASEAQAEASPAPSPQAAPKPAPKSPSNTPAGSSALEIREVRLDEAASIVGQLCEAGHKVNIGQLIRRLSLIARDEQGQLKAVVGCIRLTPGRHRMLVATPNGEAEDTRQVVRTLLDKAMLKLGAAGRAKCTVSFRDGEQPSFWSDVDWLSKLEETPPA